MSHVVSNRQGYPDIRTVDYWVGGNIAERYPQSRWVQYRIYVALVSDHLCSIMNNHNKADGFERRLEVEFATVHLAG